ncbi:MAG TPA: DUF2863 family protein [Burkholderiaceae bacterium]
MRRPAKDSSNKLSAESQRLAILAHAMGQAGSRIEERAFEHQLDQHLQKLLKSHHQDTIEATLNSLFAADIDAYDVLMDAVEAVSESSSLPLEEGETGAGHQALLIAAPILAWTRFSISSGAIPADILTTLSAHLSAHMLAEGAKMALAPTLFSIDQLPRSHAETYALTHKLALAAQKGTALKPALKPQETAPFLADTRYLIAVVVAPAGAPIFRWQEPSHLATMQADRASALLAWQTQAEPTITRLLPGCGVELLMPEAYYVACREADKAIRPVSIRAAVHYLTHTLDVDASELRAIVAGFGEEDNEGQIDEYRIGFARRGSSDIMYGVVWPLYGAEDEDGTPEEGPAPTTVAEIVQRKTPVEDILALLHDAGVVQIKKHNERFPAEYCDDCGGPMFADPQGELVHAEMPEDAPAGDAHFH